MALRMVSSCMPEPSTIMRKFGRVDFRVAITSNRFWPEQSCSSTRSTSRCVPTSGNEEEISSKSRSEWNTARKPTNCRGSLPTTPKRMRVFLAISPSVHSSVLFVRKELFQVLSNSLRHRLLILAATSLLIHRVGPKHLARTRLNQLDGDVSLVFNPGAISKQATGDFSTC